MTSEQSPPTRFPDYTCVCISHLFHACLIYIIIKHVKGIKLQGPCERFVDWWQCAAVMQRETETVTPSCSGGGNVVVV